MQLKNQMEQGNEHLFEKIKQVEAENLRLKAELEARKAGKEIKSSANKFLTSATTRAVAGKRLKKSVKKLVYELPGNPSKDTVTDVLVNLVLRVTRIGAFAIFVAAAPLLIMAVQTYILNRQNHKLSEQNTLLSKQNDRLDQQINLAEGSRRSSLVFFMSNILDRMDDELRNNSQRKLSAELIGRIVSLSQALRPYRYLENDKLTERQLSPERGQLLFSLINSNLHEETYDKIFMRANFNYADLQEANFEDAYMKNAKLAHSYFYKANFTNAQLQNADLSYAYLENATFNQTQMDNADLSNANLRNSEMEDISLKNGNLEMADLREIHLEGNFRGCNIEGIIIQEATLANVDLRNCTFRSLAWLDSLRNYKLRGFSSLVEYYEPVMEFVPNGNVADTIYRLLLDEKSSAFRAIACNQDVKEMIERTDFVIKTKKRLSEGRPIVKLHILKSPFEMQDLGIEKDSVFLFEFSSSKQRIDSKSLLISFNPTDNSLWEINSERPNEPKKVQVLYDMRLLNDLTEACNL